jgi:hypothetical protein
MKRLPEKKRRRRKAHTRGNAGRALLTPDLVILSAAVQAE